MKPWTSKPISSSGVEGLLHFCEFGQFKKALDSARAERSIQESFFQQSQRLLRYSIRSPRSAAESCAT